MRRTTTAALPNRPRSSSITRWICAPLVFTLLTITVLAVQFGTTTRTTANGITTFHWTAITRPRPACA